MEEAKKMLEYVLGMLKVMPKCYLVEEVFGDNGWDSGSFHKIPVEYPELGGLYRQVKDLVNVRVIKGISDDSINAQLGIKILGDYFSESVVVDDGLSGMSEEEIDMRVRELYKRVYGK